MLQTRALELLRSVSPYGEPLENHCIRLAEFALAIGLKEQLETDEDLVRAACFLHDIGLCVKYDTEKNYLKRGLSYFQEQSVKWGLDAEQRKTLDDALLYNHSLVKIPGIDPQADLVRRAVSVEHSHGLVTQGLDRGFCRSVFVRIPRRGFDKVLLSFFKIATIDDSPSTLFRIFFPKS